MPSQNNQYLRTLRTLYKFHMECAQGLAVIRDANSRLSYARNEMPDHAPTPATQHVHDIAAQAAADYAAHAALHPDIAGEYELRVEHQNLLIARAAAADRLDRHPARYARIPAPLPPLPPLDDAALVAAHDDLRTRLREACDRLASCDPLSRDARTLPAAVQRLRDAEGQASLRLARARERYATAVASRPDPDAMRRQLDAEGDDLRNLLASLDDDIAALATQLPVGPPRAPLTAHRVDGRPRARRTPMPHAATAPQAVADTWAARLPPLTLARYTYDPDTGVLSGSRGVTAPHADTVALTVEGRQLNVPRGVVIALVHLGRAYYLVPTTTGPDRWAWRHLVARIAGRAHHDATVPATGLLEALA